jgi:3-oxoacyl-(acyl-carrier-protein) synthase
MRDLDQPRFRRRQRGSRLHEAGGLMRGRAVVTGLGVVGPHGIGRASFEAALLAGRPLASSIDRGAGYHAADSSRYAALVPKLDLARWLPAGEARRMSLPSRFAVAAARMAVEDAGITSLEGRRVAVVLATAFGALLLTEKLVQQVLEEGPESAQPFYFSECVANAAAARVAIALGARAANVTIVEREAGPLLALARGAHEVESGRADVAIAGSADEMTELLHSLLDRFRGTARASRTHDEAPRPFDAHRDGVLAGEGATVLVIERDADAAARGARPLARVAANVAAFDPSARVTDWGDGHLSLARGLMRGLARAGRRAADIDLVVSGASGARRGDRLEADTLTTVWDGAPIPPVVVPKAVTGEFGGGLLAAAIVAMAGAPFGRPVSFGARDASLAVVPHDGAKLPAPRGVLVTALAAGGAAAWTVLERP